MRRLHSGLAFLVLPLSLAAQRPASGGVPARFDLSRVRLGTDTLDLEAAAAAGLRFVMIETVSRGTGAETGTLRLVARITGPGEGAVSSIDTVIVDAATLRFRRSSTVRVSDDGTVLYHSSETVANDELIVREPADSGERTIRTRLSPDSLPLAIPNLVMRAAPLRAGWRAAVPFRIPSAGRPLTVQVDSVTRATDAGRAVWLVHANPGDRSRLTYTIDSATRDLIRFSVRDENGAAVSEVINRRYRPRVTSAASTMPTAPPSSADAARVGGHYYLEGVHEVGSELLLRPDGTFEWMLAYGALDEGSRGRWRMIDGAVVLQSTGSRTAPGVRWFDGERLTVEPGKVLLRMNGRTLTYVRH